MKLTVNKTLLRYLDDFINRDEQKKKKKRCYSGLDIA